MIGKESLFIRAFCSQFRELCADLVRVFPTDVDIRAATQMLTGMCSSNPRLLLIVFRDAIAVPYGPQIAKGDLGFFLEKDYASDIAGSRFANSEYILNKIDMLRRPIDSLDASSKQSVIQYFQNLSNLALGSL